MHVSPILKPPTRRALLPIKKTVVTTSVFAALLLAGSPGNVTAAEPDGWRRQKETRPQMGTTMTIVADVPSGVDGKSAFSAAFKLVSGLNDKLSDYDAESELNQFSRRSHTQRPVKLSGPLFAVLMKAQQVSGTTDGAFDVTVGNLTRLWRRARRRKELPRADRLQKALAATGHRYLVLDSATQRGQLSRPGMQLDLGGIAKGFAADEALAELAKHGVKRALINLGGDLVAGDAPYGKPGWPVGIAGIDPKQPPKWNVLVRHAAIATSGDAVQYVSIAGKRYSHIVDPRTGLGLQTRSTVTVVAATGTMADAAASAVSVMGPSAGLDWARQQPQLEVAVGHMPTSKQVVWKTTKGFPQRLVSFTKLSRPKPGNVGTSSDK